MIPVPTILVFIYFLAHSIAGMAIGALTGWLTSLVTRCGPRGLIKDIFLGSFGYLVGFIGCVFMPWPENTIIERLEGGTLMTSTMNSYQHPERVAVVIAVLLPLLYELSRWKQSRVGDSKSLPNLT